jgi:hypothetical protein
MAVVAGVVALLAAWGAGQASALGITGVSAAPDDPRAGAHSNFNLSFNVSNPADQLKDLTVDLPTGLLGNPMATTQCTEAQLNADACPADSQVGTTTTSVYALLLGVQVPLDVPGTVYNVQPPANAPAQLGIVLRPVGGILGKIYIDVRIRVRDESDYGLQTIINNLPRTQSGLPIQIRSLNLTLDGALSNGGTFMVNPTTCVTATTKVTADSYASSRPVTATGAFTPTDCANEPFQPGMQIGIDQPTPDTITPHSIGVTQPADVGGRATSHIKKVVVRLPVGTSFNPSIAPTLQLCSSAQFGAQGDPNVKCPAASLVGHVAFDNPLLGTVPGDVYFGREPGNPYMLYIIGQKSGVTVKIKATVTPDNDTGQITTTFDNLPQVPFTKFNLTFNGGPRGVLVTPPSCGTYTGSLTATPWSGGPPQTPSTNFQISDDQHGGCSPKETPTISGDVDDHKALDSPTLTLDVVRDAASRRPAKLDVALPSGLLGKINSVPQCSGSDGNAGTCPASTLIGTVTVQAGSGPLPISLKGNVYLGTGTSTAVARIWLDIPVRVGPIDLGVFTLGNALTLGRTDGRVHVNANIPAAFKGFPLGLRELKLTIDRRGFLENPSGCDLRSFDVTATAYDGTTGSGTGPFQARACDELKFSPAVYTSVEDPRIKAANSQPPFQTEIVPRAGDSALQHVQVLVSAAMQPNPGALSEGLCPPAQLAAEQCPPGSLIGTASATTPLLKDTLRGNVYLSDTGTPAPDEEGVELPYASVFLKAPGVDLRLDGQLRLSPDAGRLQADFLGLPDVPLSDFKLSFYGSRPGHAGPFINVADLCAAEFAPSDATLFSQASQRAVRQPVLDAAACRRGALVRADVSGLSTAKPAAAITVGRSPSNRDNFRQVTIMVPKGLSGRPARAGAGVTVLSNGRHLAKKHWVLTKGKLTIKIPGKGADRVQAIFKKGALVPGDTIRKQARDRTSDLSGARPVILRLSAYTTELRGRKAKTTIDVDGRP